MDKFNCVAPCLFGLEKLVADELKDMGAENVLAENGRVLFSGGAEIIARANIRSRFAERVQILVGTFEARSFAELFDNVKALVWERYIGADDAFPVKGSSINSALYSIPDCQSIVKKAIVERLKGKYKIYWFDELGAERKISFLNYTTFFRSAVSVLCSFFRCLDVKVVNFSETFLKILKNVRKKTIPT